MTLYTNRVEKGSDGETRKSHYGSGKQAIDLIQELGWAPQFCAGNVLKYMRRTKDPEHSLESARWYYLRLREMTYKDKSIDAGSPWKVYHDLLVVLTEAEIGQLIEGTNLDVQEEDGA